MSNSAASRAPVDAEDADEGGATGTLLHDTYTLGPRIGKGGMGEVYEAAHVRLPGRFAVKLLRPALAMNQEAIARFSREAEIMSALRHPHIVQIFDFNTSIDGLPYFVMEFLDGVDLEARLASAGAMSLPALVRIVEASASALGAAHGLDIVHRDLKPANIFLLSGTGQDSDFVKVLDFGISQIADSGPRLSQRSVVMGTPEFMAPEQALGLADQIDGRADQFALGALAYTMLTGREPFTGSDPASLLYRVVHEPAPSLSTFFSWDTTAIQAVLDRAMAKRPEDRFERIVDFATSLRAAADATMRDPRPSAVAPARAQPTLSDEPPSVRRPRAVVPASKRVGSSLGAAKRSGRLDRIPHGPQRAMALGLGVLGLAAGIVHNGWYRGFARHATQLEQTSVSLVRGEWRPHLSSAVAAPSHVPHAIEIASLSTALPPSELPGPSLALASATVEAAHEAGFPTQAQSPGAERPPTRAAHHHNRAAYRSGWQSVAIPYHASRSPSDSPDTLPPPTRFPDPSLTPPPETIPQGFPIPPPGPLPPGRDLAPPPQPSAETRPASDDLMPGP
jgi:serine/threonine protein kinase